MPVWLVLMPDDAWVAVLVVPVTWVSQGGLEHTFWTPPMLAEAVVVVFVVPVSWVSHGGLEHTRSADMFEDAVVAVLVVPVSWVSQGGLEQTCPAPIVAEEVVAVLVVPVSWVSHGGLEQTKVTVPEPSPAAPVSFELGCSEVGEARIETGRSWTGWASTPLGVVISVT